jgi:hypothetical protein
MNANSLKTVSGSTTPVKSAAYAMAGDDGFADAGLTPDFPLSVTGPLSWAVSKFLPASKNKLPDWYPVNDQGLQWLADLVRQELTQHQGAPLSSFVPGRVRHLLITDADHTLFQTSSPIFVRVKGGGLLRDKAGKLVMLGLKSPDYKREFDKLLKTFPADKRAALELDFTEYGSIKSVLEAREIESTLREMRVAELSGDDKRMFVITARGNETAMTALEEYLADRRITADGIFGVNNPKQMDALGLGRFRLTTAQRKAMVMAVLLKLYEGQHRPIESVKFLDDTDENLIAAMQLLPKLFPKTKFEFADVVHTGKGHFEQRLVATSAGKQLLNAEGQELSAKEIDTYRSFDKPLEHSAGAH